MLSFLLDLQQPFTLIQATACFLVMRFDTAVSVWFIRSGGGDFEWKLLLVFVYAAFEMISVRVPLLLIQAAHFHVSMILLLKLLLLISLRSSSLKLCPLVGLSLENVNLVYPYLLRLFYL